MARQLAVAGGVVVGLLAGWGTAYGAPPAQIAFQGRLVDATGMPDSGVVQMAFGLFDGDGGGDARWVESQDVAVADGFYAVHLGAVAAFPPDAFANAPRFLEVTIGGEPLAPRIPFASVAYALAAAVADRIAGTTGMGEDSGLDADLLDGEHASHFALAADINSLAGLLAGLSASLDGRASGLDARLDGIRDALGAHTHAAAQLTGTVDADLLGGAARDTFASVDDLATRLATVSVQAPFQGNGTVDAPLSLAPASPTASGLMSAADKAKLDGLSGSVVPVVSTRPDNPAKGLLIFNTQTSQLEVWDGIDWRATRLGGGRAHRYWRFKQSGVTASHAPRTGEIRWYDSAGTLRKPTTFTADFSTSSAPPFDDQTNYTDTGWITGDGQIMVCDFGTPGYSLVKFQAFHVYTGGVRGANWDIAWSDDNVTFKSVGVFAYLSSNNGAVEAANAYGGYYQYTWTDAANQ